MKNKECWAKFAARQKLAGRGKRQFSGGFREERWGGVDRRRESAAEGKNTALLKKLSHDKTGEGGMVKTGERDDN